MARKVKCKLCGTMNDKDIAYKVAKGKLNSYYCSEEEYSSIEKERLLKANSLVEIGDIMGGYVPPIGVKVLNEINEKHKWEVIVKAFKKNESTIRYWLEAKDFKNEHGKYKYIATIIWNNIQQVQKEYDKEQEEIRKLFKPIEVDIIDLDVQPVARKVNDISDFLEE